MYATDTPFNSTRKPSVGPTWRTQRDRTFAWPIGKSSSPVSWKRTSPSSWSGMIGKNGGRISLREHLAQRAFVLARAVHVERRALDGAAA